MREPFHGALIVNGGYDAQTGDAALARGEADLSPSASCSSPTRTCPSASPGRALNPPDAATFYTGEEKGYTDYPALR